MHRRRPLPALFVAAALLVAACGGAEKGTGDAGGPVAVVDPSTGSSFIPGTTGVPDTTAAGTASPSPSTAPLSPSNGAPPAVRLTRLTGLKDPTALAVRPADPALYATEQAGTVQAVRDGSATLVADIGDRVLAGGERGLLGLAFSADGATLYLYWTARQPTGQVTIAAYPFADGRADVRRERVLLTIDHERFGNHNGGQLGIGPDGFLYAGVGDGGGGGNPLKTALDTRSLLGKVLRLDPTRPSGGRPYGIPAGNPFADGRGGAPEVWAYGLRNPWRFSWDRVDGRLFIADVGQNAYEEVNMVAGDQAGVNYGWNAREGLHAYNGGSRPAGAVDPIIEISHDGGVCSVTGGYLYRGTRIPSLVGRYLFTDYCDSVLRTGRPTAGGWLVEGLGVEGSGITTFGQDEAGELYVLDGRGLSRLDPA